MARPTTAEEYLEGFEGEARETLTQLRALALDAAPEGEEALKWGHPAYIGRTIWFQFSGHARHANVAFTPSTIERFRGEFGDLKSGKGTLQVPYGEPIPAALLRRMIAHRIEECETGGVNWM
ncbi:MAG: DUF1801 domain-containing protein [bacterium]|nr:DUF1801 domain-containing protein [bacterium]